MATVLAYIEPVAGRLYPLVPTLQERAGAELIAGAFRAAGGAPAAADALEQLVGAQPQVRAASEGGSP